MRFAALGVAIVAAGVLSLAHPRAAQVCDYHVSPVWNDIAATGQTGTITIDTQPGCAWTASVLTIRTQVWVTIDAASGIGPGVVHYTAAVFPSPLNGSGLRQSRIQVRWNTPTLGQDVVLTQQGGPCAALFLALNRPVSDLTFGALAGRGFIDVLADSPDSGAWTMTTSADWIVLAPPSGILAYGDGAASFLVAENAGSAARSATIVGCGGTSFTIRQAGRTAATGHYVAGDFDGDGRADLAIYRPFNGQTSGPGRWYVLLSGSNYRYDAALAIDSDDVLGNTARPLTGDFDGDGRSEAIVFNQHDNTWRTRVSSDEFGAASAGNWTLDPGVSTGTALLPFAVDFDGMGKGALTTYDPDTGVWKSFPVPGFRRPLPTIQWGRFGDIPVPGDYDGDGVADVAVWRPSEGRWYILYSASNYAVASAQSYQWGVAGDVPFAGDFDGDGRADLAVYRPSNGTWYISFSSRGYDPAAARSVQWGTASDLPLTGDYDGDGRTDLAVWRPSSGTWYLLFSSSNYAYDFARGIQWGNASLLDQPVGGRLPSQGLSGVATCPQPLHIGVVSTLACTVQVTPGTYPDSGGLHVFTDTRVLGVPPTLPYGGCFSLRTCEIGLLVTIPTTIAPGVYELPIWVTDSHGRRADMTGLVTIVP